MYSCSECGLRVVVTPEGEIIRACPHKDAPVKAEVSAQLYGISALRQMTKQEREARGI